jgi:protein TonB
VVSAGWLAQQSIFEHVDDRKIGRAMISSLAVHIGLFFAVVALLSYRPDPRTIDPKPTDAPKVVFLQQVGPGGGGGGSPAPAPPKPLEIPKHKAPAPVPVVMPPPPVETTPPPPTLDAPIITNMASVMQATGNSSVSLASFGGGGRGVGLGPGRGDGVGPGWDGGFGGGAKRPGAGINLPTIIKQVEPKYTSEAMRAKVQGAVELEAVVMPNGTIGDVRVTKSLDKAFGLDLEAIKASKGWLFRPGTGPDGKPVAVIVTLILEFRLH